MSYTYGHTPNILSAAELVYGSFEDVQAAFREVKYGKLLWRDVVPAASIDGSVNPGATELSYKVKDWRGKGAFRSRFDQSVPSVSRSLTKIRIPISVAGVTAEFDREDARQMQMAESENLLDELPKIMRMACEKHIEGTVFFGDTQVGFRGWLNYSGISVSSAVDSGRQNGATANSAAARQWANKTADQILFDINNAISTVWENSRHVHLPDTVYLPGEQISFIAADRLPDTNLTVWQFIQRNNIYTVRTGNPLKIDTIRYLDNAGSGNTARMVVGEFNDSDNMVMPFPIPFDLLEPQERGYSVDLFAEYKFGSYHVPYPGAFAYIDGI